MGKIAKDARIFFRLTQEEKEVFAEDAKIMDCQSLSEYIRKMLYTGHGLAAKKAASKKD